MLIESTTGIRRAVFLDRDGVLNAELGDYVMRPEDLTTLPGVASSVNLLINAGWLVIVFTNQAGVGRGLMSIADLDAIHERLRSDILLGGSSITALYYCPHHPDINCDCRKPKAGMLITASEDFKIDLSESIVIGDSPRDISAGIQVDCETILVLTGKTKIHDPDVFPDPQPDHIFANISSAVDWIIANR